MPRLRSDRGPTAAELAARVKAARLKRGLTQEEMAALLGIRRTTYKDTERSANPSYRTILGLLIEGGLDPLILMPEIVDAIDKARAEAP